MAELPHISNYLKLFDIYTRECETGLITFTVGLTLNNTINISVISFKVNFDKMEVDGKKNKNVRECYDNLETKLYDVKRTQNTTKRQLSKLSLISDGDSKDILSQSFIEKPDLDNKLKALKDKLKSIKFVLKNYEDFEENNITMNGALSVKGIIITNKILSEKSKIINLNEQNWIPEYWLKYEEPQTITGHVKISTVVTENLELSPDDSLLQNVVLKNSNQQISGLVAVKGTKVSGNIYTTKINGISVNKIYYKNNPTLITGLKTFENLEADGAQIKSANELEDLLKSGKLNRTFASSIVVENLEVESVNGILWEEFKNSIFRVGITDSISGFITIPQIQTEKLRIKTLNGIDVEYLFTTSTNQTIAADITFTRIFAENITAGTVNGIKLTEAITFGDTTPIKGPVIFDKLNVVKDIELSKNFDEAFFSKSGDHVMGTNESDLAQLYKETVKIKGNLALKNLILQENVSLFVGEEELPNITNTYWTKNRNQKIPFNVTLKNGLKVPFIFLKSLNDVQYNQYMVNNTNDNFETDYHFQDLAVYGNVIVNITAKNKPDVIELNKQAVKTNGTFLIDGQKKYIDILKTENLVTDKLEDINTLEAVNKKWAVNVNGTKVFKNITIKGDLNGRIENPNILNNISVVNFKDNIIGANFKDNVVFTDKEQNYIELNFEHLNATNLYVKNLNKHPIDDLILKLGELKSLKEVNNLIISDNLTISNAENVSTINDIKTKQFLNNSKSTKGKFSGISIDVSVTGKLKLNNLATKFINEIDLVNLTSRILYRSIPQNITGSYHFINIKTGNIFTSKIKNVYVQHLIDVSKTKGQVIQAPSEFYYGCTLKTLYCNSMSPCNIKELYITTNSPPTQNWHVIEIAGNVSIFDEESTLYRIFEKTVKRSEANIVSGPVNFSQNAFANTVVSKEDISNANITELFEDAITTDPKTEQSGTVSNIKPDNIVNLDSPKKVPATVFDTLKILKNFNISFVNNINLTDTLNKRLLLASPKIQFVNAVYYFDDLTLEKMTTPSINNTRLDEVIFDNHKEQNIFSRKLFMDKVEIFENIQVEVINSINISKEYGKAIINEEFVTINGSLTVLEPSSVNCSISTEFINGYPIFEIQQILENSNNKTDVGEILNVKNKVIKDISKNVLKAQNLPMEYMYLEKSHSFQISVSEVLSATSITSKGYVLIHINGEIPGKYCNLPDKCPCPTQCSIEISPEQSVALLPNNGVKRIFSYYDKTMIVHFVTNTISRGSECRANTKINLVEGSKMTWTTAVTNNTDTFFQYKDVIRGYITKVEFFTQNGKIYAIIGRHYDPLKDIYDLDTVVIKFSENKTSANQIQNIPTKGVEELYLFYTAQGVVLIIGNVKEDEEETQIYKFNVDREEFELLRIIPFFGCSGATGVVLGTDSLIILRHRFAPVQILKFYPQFENYYHYQSFDLEEQVTGVSVFYSAEFGKSDTYMVLTTHNNNFYIYSYKFIEGWVLKSNSKLEGLKNLIPIEQDNHSYLFAASTKYSSLLTIVQNGSV